MSYKYNKDLVDNAKDLRKNMTPEERRLWYDFLRRLPCHTRRQKTIESYIVDFYIAEHKVVIELDGSQHGFEKNVRADAERDKALQRLGIKVRRYTNISVNDSFEGVCNDILKLLGLTWADLKPVR